MNWRFKVAACKLLSTLPGGRALYRFSQKHLTHSLTPTRARVSQKISVAAQYFEWLVQHQQADRLLEGAHLDFGAGWHPTIPLFFYSLGVKRQHLLDVAPLLDAELVRQTVHTFLSVVQEPGFPQRSWLRQTPPPFEPGSWPSYLQDLGFSYHAPYAQAVASLAGGADVATSTQVLPYVPDAVVPWCFEQIYKCLKPGGLFLATVYLRDAFVDGVQPGLPKYHPLQYSPQTWERWINSALISYNRLKAPDYRLFLEQAGFEVVHFEVEPGTAADLKELEQVPIADCFKRYTREDLAARHLFFVARKR